MVFVSKQADGGIAPAGLSFKALVEPLAVAAVLAFTKVLFAPATFNLTLFYAQRQDRWLLLAAALIMVAIASLCARGWEWRKPLAVPGVALVALGLAMAALAWWGHHALLFAHDVSRDEQMATFDAAVLVHGQLAAPLPAAWRDHADALNTLFMYPAEHRGAWASSYLPMNALLRGLVGMVADPGLAGALWWLAGFGALWGCARTIWPEDREAAVIALLLYAASGQVLFAAMTSYAMPAHLALDLAWLWAFLRRAWWADLAALAIGFVAIGLHQPLMHPMFAAPLLCLLLVERAWGRAALFAAGYAAIGVFWLWWPNFMWQLVQADPHALKPAGVDYLSRMIETVRGNGPGGLGLMLTNLVRFVAWQPLVLLPLIGLARPVLRHSPLAAALAGGCVLTVVVMLVLLPYQGHGFGYRYLHGLIGNAILLAVFGWKTITEARRKAAARTAVLAATLAGVALILPWQAAMARAFYAPWAQASAAIGRTAADYVVIGAADAPFSQDLVLNPPDLDRRPVRLLREGLDRPLATQLCAGHPRLALAGPQTLAPIARYFGQPAALDARTQAENARVAAILAAMGCRIVAVP